MTALDNILKGIEVLGREGTNAGSINKVCFDSRKVEKGDMFVAVRGTELDGHNFIAQALSSGATVIICEDIPENAGDDTDWIRVKNSAHALGVAASAYYSNPAGKLKLVGITGTNGKTTVATLLYETFRMLGYGTGLLSTISNYIDGRESAATHTTPDPVEINRLLGEMVDCGCEYAFMEVSSHAIAQERIAGIEFAGAVFTNITQDHLDYHKTFNNYIAAKKAFFDNLGESAFALVNRDDRNSEVMLQNCKAGKHYFSLRSVSEYMARLLENRIEGMLLKIGPHEVSTGFIGEFNAYNLLAVYAASILLGANEDESLTTLSKLKPVRGRMEIIPLGSGSTGVVDYAHTPDAVSNAISTLSSVKKKGSGLWVVLGAGGNRDRGKRGPMARIAAEGADQVILTSDNPRNEEPEEILDEMMAGVPPGLKKKVLRISNRREAIKTAVTMAGRGDIILVAGKGHETYQEIKGVRHHFDDVEELHKCFE